jgi:hypothetical protein
MPPADTLTVVISLVIAGFSMGIAMVIALILIFMRR